MEDLAPTPQTVPDPQRPVAPAFPPFRYDGLGTELFRIYLKNILLSILTLGIYSFWAKVVVQRYHFQHTTFYDGRFDYHATGREKFMGFLKGSLVLSPLVGVSVALYFALVGPLGVETATLFSIYLFFFLFALMRPLVLVGRWSFNLARSSWNNLYFRFVGRIGDAYRLYMKDYLLIVVTFGFYIPWHKANVRGFTTEHTRFGNARFDYTGTGSDLLAIYVLGLMACYLSLGICVPWYLAFLFRYHTRNTRFEAVPFTSSLTGWQAFKTLFAAFFLVVCTLGIAFPWAVRMVMRMYVDSVSFTGTINLDAIQAAYDAEANALMEGIGEAGEALSAIGDMLGG